MTKITQRRTRLSIYAATTAAITVLALTGSTWAAPATAAPLHISTSTSSTPASDAALADALALRAAVSNWATAAADGSPAARALAVNPAEPLPAGETLTGLAVINDSPVTTVGDRCIRANISFTSPVETAPDGTQTRSRSNTPYDLVVNIADPANPTVVWARAFAPDAQATCH